MSYIGRDLRAGAFRQLDDISSGFDGSTTGFTMQVNSGNVQLGDVNQILLSLGGVIQKPGTDFTISTSTLTFTTAPASGLSFFAILLGSDNGGTVTPTDASVTTAKLADTSVTSAKLSGNLVTPGTLDVNGQELILDADADTSVTADTDDQIDIRIAGADDFQFTANTFTAQSGSTITTPTLGVGNTKDLGAGIHVKVADSGVSAVNSAADELVLENSASCGLSIFSGTGEVGKIAFGDSDDNNRAEIFYNHSTDHMTFIHEGDETFTMGGGRTQTGGETSGDVSAGGLCLNQNTSDTAILSFKSTGDVAHGMTSLEQTDTWASFHKDNATDGGVRIRICSGQVKSLKIECFATGENTAEATSALSNFAVDGRPKSGTSVQSHDGDANIASFRTGDAAQVIFKGDGEIFSNQTSTVGTFDEYDDAQLIRSYDLTRGEGNKVKGLIASKFDKFVKYNRDDLKDARLIGKDENGNATNFINLNGFIRLHNGAIWQQYEKHQKLVNAMYELAKKTIGKEEADKLLTEEEIQLLN